MPPTPQWHPRLPAIRAALDELPSPAVDRALVEELFGISRSSAVRLLNRVTPPRAGRPSVVTREELAAWLDRELARRPVRDAVRRRRELGARLAAAGRDGAQSQAQNEFRHTPIAAPEPATGADLPPGVTLDTAGALRIGFRSPEELLARVLALAELAAADYPGFARRLADAGPA